MGSEMCIRDRVTDAGNRHATGEPRPSLSPLPAAVTAAVTTAVGNSTADTAATGCRVVAPCAVLARSEKGRLPDDNQAVLCGGLRGLHLAGGPSEVAGMSITMSVTASVTRSVTSQADRARLRPCARSRDARRVLVTLEEPFGWCCCAPGRQEHQVSRGKGRRGGSWDAPVSGAQHTAVLLSGR